MSDDPMRPRWVLLLTDKAKNTTRIVAWFSTQAAAAAARDNGRRNNQMNGVTDEVWSILDEASLASDDATLRARYAAMLAEGDAAATGRE
jgi:hypothetical protein